MDDYYLAEGLNQSAIKQIIDGGIESYLVKREELKLEVEKKHLIIGSGVDTIITMGEQAFIEKYHVSNIEKKPGDKALAIIKEVFAVVSANTRADDINLLRNYPEEVYNACESNEYYMNRRKANYMEDNRISEILKDNAEVYWRDLCDAEGKQVLSVVESNAITNISKSLLTHKHTSHLFVEDQDVDIIYQLPIFFAYKGIKVKMMLDELKIKHNEKAILPLDIKTTGDYVLRFNKTIKSYRYDIQGSFYTFGIGQNLALIESIIGRNLTGYQIANFAFAVESTVSQGTPMIFPLTDDLLKCGQTGDKYLLGWEQGIDIYITWLNSNFSLEKRFESTNGVVWVGNNFEYNQTF